MPWSKGGDTGATHPALLAADDARDERALNEVAGFVLRAYLQSAGHMTDYVLDEGTARLLGRSRTDWLVRRATRAGLLERVPGRSRCWKLLEDPEFVHLRLRADVERERRRKRDNANEALTVQVRLRDGDECRYCGSVVNWRDRKGGRGGTYDHNPPVQPGQATTVGGLFVSCQRCNGTRGALADPDGLLPLRPQPMEPYFTALSVAYLGERGHVVRPGAPRPGEQQEQQPAPSARPRTQRAPEQQEQQAAPSATGAAGGEAGAAASAQRPTPHPASPGAAGAAGSAQRPPVARDHHGDADPATGPPGPAQGPPAWAVDGPDPGGRPAGPADLRHSARDGSGRDGLEVPPPSRRLPSPTHPAPTSAQPPPDSRPRARRRGGRGRGSKRTSEET
ncbi:HNH endonuclease [Pseudokineococcus lusitanus]|uniref:5-methylcytosine-specific restriction endonuclease McrA n=1 Tax=Pseudokineococcus lusitanus TaxID=763993 RepID=A0A3N1HTU3_9ACTN|nr:HNH endonuclease [Pseudokineococcus lusitanus]ROP45931.1 5-methylcytosine-specific restriction endonuclease McrA [Pseudokineococcus lusitanus]